MEHATGLYATQVPRGYGGYDFTSSNNNDDDKNLPAAEADTVPPNFGPSSGHTTARQNHHAFDPHFFM